MKEMFDLGADEVIPEEFETSIEIFTRVMAKYLIPHDVIEKLVAEVRADGYQMFRSLSLEDQSFSNLTVNIPEVEIHSIHVCTDAPILGEDFRSSEFSKQYNLTPLAVSRGQEMISLPAQNFTFRENDVLFVLGQSKNLVSTLDLFKSPDESCETPGEK
jgi:CPA2 family monovalent cation:H+ antiporter-2